ncbi:MAG: hypothetical protein LBJ94_03820 [Puniceicoccales bacterium]|jgi:sugar/nucleoside kinase (ribokinase family)|nr:hypothetical protein [Puniceicoccales bacterium]
MSIKGAFIGFDGFVDRIIRVIDHWGSGGKVHVDSIGDFGRKILAASGKSTNIELESICEKIGGNGPLLSEALRKLGTKTIYVGTIGHEIFDKFAADNNAISIGQPGKSQALEFNDGKVIFGEMCDVAKVDLDLILRHVGRQKFIETLRACDLLCFVNWTMLTKLNGILEFVLGEVGAGKIFFFDLADPAKRTADDIRSICTLIGNFSELGKVILGANLREAAQILAALGKDEQAEETRESMTNAAKIIGESIGIEACFVHANTMAAGYDGTSACVNGYFSPHPKISTGAGDHFNAGFLQEYVATFNLSMALHGGSAAAKYYVDNAMAPSLTQVKQMRLA